MSRYKMCHIAQLIQILKEVDKIKTMKNVNENYGRFNMNSLTKIFIIFYRKQYRDLFVFYNRS